jgi:SagB-type dehydrogenase family enzyme
MEKKIFGRIQPLVIAYGYPKNSNQMTFLGYGEEIIIEGCNDLLNKLLPMCNGMDFLEDILEKLEGEYPIDSLVGLIKALLEYEILIDSQEFYWVLHKRSMNPSLYGEELSDEEVVKILERRNYKTYSNREEIPLSSFSDVNSGLLEFIRARRSIWQYSSRSISFTQVSGLLRTAYGVIRREDLGSYVLPHRTVPSGGGLYPLEVYVIILIENDRLSKGLYYFHKEKEYLVFLKSGDFREKLKELIWTANEAVETASLFLIITARFSRECEKYANRGYRHIWLEAGHVAQNVYLYCIDQNLGTVELSGFLDEKLCSFLGINPREEAPITILAVGSR